MTERYCVPSSGPCRFSSVGSCATEKKTFSNWPYEIWPGSYTMRTDSACPVVPVLTVSYCAVCAEPPEYPAVTLLTPFTCSKTACMPQKHPPPRTTVCAPWFLLSGASVVGSGSLTALAAWQESVLKSNSRKAEHDILRNIATPFSQTSMTRSSCNNAGLWAAAHH